MAADHSDGNPGGNLSAIDSVRPSGLTERIGALIAVLEMVRTHDEKNPTGPVSILHYRLSPSRQWALETCLDLGWVKVTITGWPYIGRDGVAFLDRVVATEL